MTEKLYQDFKNEFLPHIQEGLVITKDYFFDLFGRYVKFLLVWDSIMLIVAVVTLIFAPIITYKLVKKGRKMSEEGDGAGEVMVVFSIFIGGFITIISFGGTLVKTEDVVKDIYIPEVRVYEELKSEVKNNNN